MTDLRSVSYVCNDHPIPELAGAPYLRAVEPQSDMTVAALLDERQADIEALAAALRSAVGCLDALRTTTKELRRRGVEPRFGMADLVESAEDLIAALPAEGAR